MLMRTKLFILIILFLTVILISISEKQLIQKKYNYNIINYAYQRTFCTHSFDIGIYTF